MPTFVLAPILEHVFELIFIDFLLHIGIRTRAYLANLIEIQKFRIKFNSESKLDVELIKFTCAQMSEIQSIQAAVTFPYQPMITKQLIIIQSKPPR